MTLLVMIALAILSLSTIELRQAKRSDSQAEARANARMALMIALGELQKNMGPDQRVCAQAAMFDTNISTHDKIDDVQNPYWVGIFSTVADDGSSLLSRNVDAGGEWDKRTTPDRSGQWEIDWAHGNRHKQVLNYLVSGNEGHSVSTPVTDFQDAMTTNLPAEKSIELVKMDYTPDDPRRVKVKLVPTRKHRITGSYGWWIRDLGSAAKISIADAYAGKSANPNNPTDGGYYRILAAAETPGKYIDPALDTTVDVTSKIVDGPQLELISAGAKTAFRKNWFDITAHGYGVLANIRTGKLRRNLSDYLNKPGNSGSVSIPALQNGSITSPGISDTDYLIGLPNPTTQTWLGKTADSQSWRTSILKRSQTAPRLGTLREYAQLANQVVFSNGQSNQVWAPTVSNPPGGGAYDGHNKTSIRLRNPSGHSLQPILTESTIYYNISTFPKSVGGKMVHRLRVHYYPRFTLWNPYNATLKLDRMTVWFQTTGNKPILMGSPDGISLLRLRQGNGGGVLEGSMYFTLNATTLEPGECVVFSSSNTRPYGSHPMQNVLTANTTPDPSKNFYLDADRGGFNGGTKNVGGTTYQIYDFPRRPTSWRQFGGGEGAEDVRVMLKQYAASVQAFINSPSILAISGSPKIGAINETPLTWNTNNAISPIPQTTTSNGALNARTRDSIRLRWIEEPQSNILNSGISDREDAENLFSSAYFSNWNLRAAFIIKSPFSNMAPRQPFFHGIYSRDIGGPESEWNRHTPPVVNGRARGNPFGYNQDALDRYIIFDIPRKETGIVSLAQFQHAKLTDYGWMTGSAIGNSFADPRMERYRTTPKPRNNQYGGWNATYFGNNSDYIASLARGMIHNVANSENVVYDLSHNANRALWDDYFLAANSNDALTRFLDDSQANPLPNSRLRLLSRGHSKPNIQDLDFHRAAKWLVLDGAFNVNSTSVAAWRSLLSSTHDSGLGKHVFPSLLNAPGGTFQAGNDPLSEEGMSGNREMTAYEIEALAEKIVEQVKLRGPFLSLSDFVNRRLVDDETGLMGALQAAIEATDINASYRAGQYQINNYKELPDFAVNTSNLNGIADSTKLSHRLKPTSKLAGAPGYLTQANLLQTIGPVISARSDCFMIRAYGEAKDANGNVIAKAFCQAIVQRTPDPVDPEEPDYKLNPATPSKGATDYGRKFVIQSFRWLSPEEV